MNGFQKKDENVSEGVLRVFHGFDKVTEIQSGWTKEHFPTGALPFYPVINSENQFGVFRPRRRWPAKPFHLFLFLFLNLNYVEFHVDVLTSDDNCTMVRVNIVPGTWSTLFDGPLTNSSHSYLGALGSVHETYCLESVFNHFPSTTPDRELFRK